MPSLKYFKINISGYSEDDVCSKHPVGILSISSNPSTASVLSEGETLTVSFLVPSIIVPSVKKSVEYFFSTEPLDNVFSTNSPFGLTAIVLSTISFSPLELSASTLNVQSPNLLIVTGTYTITWLFAGTLNSPA